MEEIEQPSPNKEPSDSIEHAELESLDVKVGSKTTIRCENIKSEMTIGVSVIKEPPKNSWAAVTHAHKYTSTQMPWEEKVTLITPKLNSQMILPEYANYLAIQTFLKMCNLSYEIEQMPNAMAVSPTKTVPFIKVEKCVVGGLDGIIQFVNNKNISLSDKLDHDQKINLNAYMSLTTNTLKLVELYICWMHKETYKKVTRIKNGSAYPWPLNWMQNIVKYKRAYRQLACLDWKNKTLAEVLFEFEKFCEAVSDRLNKKAYFFDEGDTELDACMFGHLFAILNTPLPGHFLADTIKKYPDLLSLTRRVKTEYF